MQKPTIVLLAFVLLLFLAAAPALATPPIQAAGSFTAAINFPTLSLTPVGSNCLLEVDGTLSFTGTLEGEASGTTRALVFAPCTEVGMSPPGTFRDIFRSDLTFSGTVDGIPATADITYRGKTAAGGAIDAQMALADGLTGLLKVDAIVIVGGSYEGFVINQ